MSSRGWFENVALGAPTADTFGSVVEARALAQRLFAGPWQHAAAALDACRTDTWPAFVNVAAPPRPLLWGRLDHARCVERAARKLDAPVSSTTLLVPVWACSTFEEDGAEWVAAHVEAPVSGPLVVLEAAPYVVDADLRVDQVLECSVRRWSAATVVEGDAYAPSVPLLLRSGGYAVCGQTIVEVLEVEARAGRPVPRPTRSVPPFATWFSPRVVVSADVEARIAALCHTETEDDAALA